MPFHSHFFIFMFFPIVLSLFFLTGKFFGAAAAKVWVLLGSLFFYAYFKPIYLILIITSILINLWLSQIIISLRDEKKMTSSKNVMWLAIFLNLAYLGFYKYFDFTIEATNYIFGSNLALLNFALPLGISFYTLQQIGFIVDSYQGVVKKGNYLNYGVFVSFFPQLIAGPIVHHKDIIKQLSDENFTKINMTNIKKGFFYFSVGLFKKVILADTLGIYADKGFESIETLTFAQSWFSSFSYMFQLYFDFSGYTDMAFGLAFCFNITLLRNFDSPYKALNIIDFWKRWHISLTNFIGSYIYTPLLRSFKKITFGKMLFGTFVTMQIAGIWHGAAFKFIVFGCSHSTLLVINHYFKSKKRKMNKYVSWFFTLVFVNITFVLFRANTTLDAFAFLRQMFSFDGIAWSDWINVTYILISLVITTQFKNIHELEKENKEYPVMVNLALFVISIVHLTNLYLNDLNTDKFIYFDF